jgi:hypothetical protein
MKMYDADSLIAKLEAARNGLLMRGQIAAERNVAKFALQVVYDEPTVDAEPVRHGRWEYVNASHGMMCSCSECGEIPECFEPNYCPNCGAKMDGGAEDDDSF